MSLDLSRRSLLGGIITLGMAPAIVRVSSIMPVKPVEDLWIHGDRIRFGLGTQSTFHGSETLFITNNTPDTVTILLTEFGEVVVQPNDTHEILLHKYEEQKQRHLVGAA